MEEHMNKPVRYDWSDQDVVVEYQKYHDKRKVARIYNISVKEVNTILRKVGEIK